MLVTKRSVHEVPESDTHFAPAYGTRFMSSPVPRLELPATMVPPDVVYQLIRDALRLPADLPQLLPLLYLQIRRVV